MRRFRPRRMVGVDIDDYLIQLARDVRSFVGLEMIARTSDPACAHSLTGFVLLLKGQEPGV